MILGVPIFKHIRVNEHFGTQMYYMEALKYHNWNFEYLDFNGQILFILDMDGYFGEYSTFCCYFA